MYDIEFPRVFDSVSREIDFDMVKRELDSAHVLSSLDAERAIRNTTASYNAFDPDIFRRSFNELSLILRTDSYKIGHKRMIPETGKTYAYLEARAGAEDPEVMFFGLQYFLVLLKRLVVTERDVMHAKRIINSHLGPDAFDEEAWMYIVRTYGGRLPIEVYAPDEGTMIPQGNVMLIVSNTDDECYWLPTYIESFLEHLWFSCTVATLSKRCKIIMQLYLDETSENPGAVNFMLHDFGYRGVSSDESAAVGGAAHIVNFMGTDTVPALDLVERYYRTPVCAYSVVATEHSVMTKYGRGGEYEVIRKLIQDNPNGILSMVIDSYNYRDAIHQLGTTFKDMIMARDGKLVVRPDSGDPLEVSLEIMQMLDRYFGTVVNEKGCKVLCPKIGLIYGDGINPTMIQKILKRMKEHGYSAENIVFGMGGGLLQKLNRDTERFAYKVCAFKPTGRQEWVPIFKDPISTEGGSKRSKSGTLILIRDDSGRIHTISGNMDDPRCILKLRFMNGELFNITDFAAVREQSNA